MISQLSNLENSPIAGMMPIMPMHIPMVIQKTAQGDRAFDIYSRMLKERLIYLTGPIFDFISNAIIPQLMFLNAEEQPTASSGEPNSIKMLVNSPGGVITAGLAIIDTMNHITCPVETTVVGMAASMGAVIAACGEKGKRKAMKNAEFLIHQPMGGAQGQATDITIAANHINAMKKRLNIMLAEATGKDELTIEKDSDRDNIMSAQEALAYGLIDRIN